MLHFLIFHIYHSQCNSATPRTEIPSFTVIAEFTIFYGISQNRHSPPSDCYSWDFQLLFHWKNSKNAVKKLKARAIGKERSTLGEMRSGERASENMRWNMYHTSRIPVFRAVWKGQNLPFKIKILDICKVSNIMNLGRPFFSSNYPPHPKLWLQI